MNGDLAMNDSHIPSSAFTTFALTLGSAGPPIAASISLSFEMKSRNGEFAVIGSPVCREKKTREEV